MVATPFNAGVSNGINEVFGTSLPNGTIVLIFNGTSYTSWGYDASLGADPRNWYDGGFTTPGLNLPSVPPGTGMFVQGPGGQGNWTNTFVGTVAVNAGASGTNNIANGNYVFTGSQIPFAGDISTNCNLLPPNGTIVEFWDPVHTTFVSYGYDASLGADANNWYDGGFSTPEPTPQLNVAQGFFIVGGGFGAPGTYQWVQSLP
jgi:hypothetical protein